MGCRCRYDVSIGISWTHLLWTDSLHCPTSPPSSTRTSSRTVSCSNLWSRGRFDLRDSWHCLSKVCINTSNLCKKLTLAQWRKQGNINVYHRASDLWWNLWSSRRSPTAWIVSLKRAKLHSFRRRHWNLLLTWLLLATAVQSSNDSSSTDDTLTAPALKFGYTCISFYAPHYRNDPQRILRAHSRKMPSVNPRLLTSTSFWRTPWLRRQLALVLFSQNATGCW